jgi:hypothetical protein
MYRNQKRISVSGVIVLLLSLLNAVVLKQAFVAHSHWYWLLAITLPLLLISLLFFNKRQGE